MTFAGVHFSSDASLWICWLEQRLPKDWTIIFTLLFQHFGSAYMNGFKSTFCHIQPMGTLEEYFALFTKLACQALDLTMSQLKHVFDWGLKEFRFDV